jgi:uncharacterized damage-inducible protein DinB
MLGSLGDTQWAASTAAPDWSVKYIALHLLAVDLGWLARGRDGDRSGLILVSLDHEHFISDLGESNLRWTGGHGD